MNVQLPQKVGRPKKEFVAFATTQNGRWTEETLRRRWQEANALETDRRRWEIANSSKPYDGNGGATREDVFDAIRECFEIGETFTVSDLVAEFIDYTGTTITKNAMQNHLYASRDCGLIKCVRRGVGSRKQEAVWRRCK